MKNEFPVRFTKAKAPQVFKNEQMGFDLANDLQNGPDEPF